MLTSVTIPSIYNNKPLPSRMAKCSPDMAPALVALTDELKARGASLILSDLFRSYDMQFQAHLDYTSGKKKAFSPAPGGSMHEAGRAMDISLEAIHPLGLQDFWDIAMPLGFMPIIAKPTMGASESWHFDFRGSFQKIYDYTVSHPNGVKPYRMMSALAILDQDIHVDDLDANKDGYLIQSALVRLDREIGILDGCIGENCVSTLADVGFMGTTSDLPMVYTFLMNMLQATFPEEYPC